MKKNEESLKDSCSVQFSLVTQVVSDSLRPHEQQHARPPCPSPTPRVYPDSRPLSWWCHPTILSSVVPFSSCLQSFPTSGSFQMSQLGLYQRDEYTDYIWEGAINERSPRQRRARMYLKKEWPKLTKFEEIHGYTNKRNLNKPQRRGTQRVTLTYNWTAECQRQRWNLKSNKIKVNGHISIQGLLKNIVSIFLSRILQARRQWKDAFKELKEEQQCHLKALYLAKLSFKKKREIKTSQISQKLR